MTTTVPLRETLYRLRRGQIIGVEGRPPRDLQGTLIMEDLAIVVGRCLPCQDLFLTDTSVLPILLAAARL